MKIENGFPPVKNLISLFSILIAGILLLPVFKSGDKAPAESNVAVISRHQEQEQAHIIKPGIPEPELLAHAYSVRFVGVEKPLLEKRRDKIMAPASITKVLTATLAMEMLPANEYITLSSDAKNIADRRSSARTGEAFLRDDLVRFAMVLSANDSATALAEAIGRRGGGKTFEERMEVFARAANKKAEELGMRNTRVANGSGLDDVGHYSTAEDLSLLAEYVWLNYPRIWEMSRAIESTVYSDAFREYKFSNSNILLSEFPAIFGGKTGFTNMARESLMLLYPTKDARTAIIVILGSENRFEDGRKIIRWLEEVFDQS